MVFDKKAIGILGGAVVLRLVVFSAFSDLCDFFTSQVEISTPVSSFKRLKEGLFLYERGVSPYDGGLFHQAPLLLVIFGVFPSSLLFTALDLVNAVSLKIISENLRLPSPRFKPLDGTIIAAAYLFNPLTILSCLGRSPTLLSNAAIIQAVLAAQSSNGPRAMISLAFGAYLSMYPALLLPPILLLLLRSGGPVKNSAQLTAVNIGYFVASLTLLIGSTVFISGDIKEFIGSCYGMQITVPDLTPNVGLWWYFFIEIFDSFRDFFIGVFWLHMAGYVGGMTFRLHKEPLFVVASLTGLFAVFKPYPSIADVSLYLGFLPMYQHVLGCEFRIIPDLHSVF
jgi:GPI-anchor transamidase subunit U